MKKVYLYSALCLIVLFTITVSNYYKKLSTDNPQTSSITSHYHSKDVIRFLTDNNNIPSSYAGLHDEKLLNKLLEEQDYVEVLRFLWSEKDSIKRIQWLREKAENGHVICMFELSKELANTKQLEESWYWHTLGMLRAEQDAQCCTDLSVNSGVDALLLYYSNFLRSAMINKTT